MKKKIDLNMPIGELVKIKDFLPPPEELMARGEKVKVTLYLKKANIDTLKNIAKQSHAKYQKIIRELVDSYVDHYARPIS
ncbi:CopG family transcriptional regulator [Candidatus Desantisbacteria bacterium CG_4_10_14_0_8_um_filter_48_22]|uniref:CopG family transcriptional regulator n=1 Tax=Candidatus Desantisbacteria bacterium CG_4_10_14_0_8_um_filter_48_22 TaxID=1974543 RepID=A0A2M7S9R5_9BACT|nr:MAG: hypothetical protein AUJ67_00575 [Candidatus Desantisbacteria bacterium CG1_02_49_89]PIV56972.1 MAG: CopG family transcriptional regulator [Candidatus Desantisbacteria bacterium CG02_land_8_20_14_3_00_49_13]PIZ16230.1 MAG: CopG family transcriptional regulator [Candidatus Desantisbacteria bacterium CG_4_10_14_0_8_um_filter_48_22]PJB28923.1 MAG: CopG family transcriptional regulator [Candidatus Desantisbacteria bacterium CG_4_9_14_3_um_filter_50_7]